MDLSNNDVDLAVGYSTPSGRNMASAGDPATPMFVNQLTGPPVTLAPHGSQVSGSGVLHDAIALQQRAEMTPVFDQQWSMTFRAVHAEVTTGSDTPEKRALRSQLLQLENHLSEVEHFAEMQMRMQSEQQQARFAQIARNYEAESREITRRELAQSTAESEARAKDEIFALHRSMQSEMQAQKVEVKTAEMSAWQRSTSHAEQSIHEARRVLQENFDSEYSERYAVLVRETEQHMQQHSEELHATLAEIKASKSRDELKSEELAESNARSQSLARQLWQAEQSFTARSSNPSDRGELQLELAQTQGRLSKMQYECDQMRTMDDTKDRRTQELMSELEFFKGQCDQYQRENEAVRGVTASTAPAGSVRGITPSAGPVVPQDGSFLSPELAALPTVEHHNLDDSFHSAQDREG